MKIKDLKDKKIDELKKLLKEKRENVRGIRFGTSGSKSKNVKEISGEKKTIARILTLINNQASTK